MPAALSVDDLLRARWRATGLPTSTPGAAKPTAAAEVRRLGAVQAQEFETTLWSLGRRTAESRTSILAGFERGEFVRTHTLRPTWHFVHRDDLDLLQAATADRVHRLNGTLYRQEGLDRTTLQKAGAVIAAAVSERPLTRAQIRERLSAEGFSLSNLGLTLLMMWAELERLVASGPLAGRRQTYAPWPARTLPDRAEAVTRLAERFFSSHGPATVDDFATWSSLTKGTAREALAGLPVERAEVEGAECLWLGELSTDPWASPQVELLNCYDEYVSGFGVAGKRWFDRAGLAPGRLGIPIGLVVVDGQLAGNWRRTIGRTAVAIEVVPLRPLSGAERDGLAASAAAYGSFLGVPARLTISGAG
jgi:hypothetical protein